MSSRPMVLYNDAMSWLMAKFYDGVMAKTESACLGTWRKEWIGQVRGRVLELGAGTGVNIPFYTNAVSEVCLTEPDPNMRHQLETRLTDACDSRMYISASSAEALSFPDAHFDWVVSTLVLCSVEDPSKSLKEVYRVLRPGGGLVFIEHVCAKNNPARLKWQRRIEPIWRRIADGCHLTRDTASSILNAGFSIESIAHESMRKAPPFIRPSIRGVARKKT